MYIIKLLKNKNIQISYNILNWIVEKSKQEENVYLPDWDTVFFFFFENGTE